MNPPKSRLATTSLLVLAGALAAAIGWYSVKVFRAELRAVAVRAAQDAWAAQGTLPSVAEWQQVLDSLDAAIALDPANAEYRRLRGLMQEWRGYSVNHVDVSIAELLTARRLAVAAYRETTRLRPNHAPGWAHLARMKALAGERDAEFNTALRNAMRFGRHLEEVNVEVAFVATLMGGTFDGTDAVDEDDAALRAEVKAAILRGLHSAGSREAVLAYLEEGALLAQFCTDAASLPEAVQPRCGGGL